MNINIRDMKESDIDRIIEIDYKCFSSPWSKESFEFEINSNPLAIYTVVEEEELILGYIGIWLMFDEAHVVSIGVDPEYRRRGIGKTLMSTAILKANEAGMNSMTLEVRKSNIGAKNLYLDFGFEEVGIRPRYYEDNNEDAIIMWKYFKDV